MKCWEVGRYGSRFDGLEEADRMMEEGGREGGREGGQTHKYTDMGRKGGREGGREGTYLRALLKTRRTSSAKEGISLYVSAWRRVLMLPRSMGWGQMWW